MLLLDPSLFSLLFKPRANGVDIFEASNGRSAGTQAYAIDRKDDVLTVSDGLTGTELATSKSTGSKSRVVELLNPSCEVKMESIGFAIWEQEISYEASKFVWKRGISLGGGGSAREYKLYAVRRPDPDILIASYEPQSDSRPGVLQFLDYNLSRIDPPIEDRRGLEIVILASLWSFIDSSSGGSVSPSNVVKGQTVPADALADELNALEADDGPPVGPNEVLVVNNLPMQTLIEHCLSLLADRQTVLIKLIARSTLTVPKAVQLASEVKRARQRKTGEELRQYMLDTEQLKRANSLVPRIDLTPETTKKRRSAMPPSSIEIVLSRMPLPELEPRPRPTPSLHPGPPVPAKAPTQRKWWQ